VYRQHQIAGGGLSLARVLLVPVGGFMNRERATTGGGTGKHMVYLSGVTDHHVQSEDMLDHIVMLVEKKAAELDAQSALAEAAE